MPVLSIKENAYGFHTVFKPVSGRVSLRGTNLGHSYARESVSRSVSDDQNLSSFRSPAAAIESLFAVQSADVHRYLQSHADLYSLLLRSRAEIYWLFGPRTSVVLRMERDPEGEFDARLLIAIQTRLGASHAINLVDMLDERWWLSVRPQARALMKIDVEYI
jgi:hypothetical protein